MKLKKKHLKGTVPGMPNKTFEQLNERELKEIYEREGYSHLFEKEKIINKTTKEPKDEIIPIKPTVESSKEEIAKWAQYKGIDLDLRLGAENLYKELEEKGGLE